jgi:hypothetical protein
MEGDMSRGREREKRGEDIFPRSISRTTWRRWGQQEKVRQVGEERTKLSGEKIERKCRGALKMPIVLSLCRKEKREMRETETIRQRGGWLGM